MRSHSPSRQAPTRSRRAPALACLACLACLALTLHAAPLRAQLPPIAPGTTPTQPTLPAGTLPIELVKSGPSTVGQVYYERAGLKPREYRVASTASAVASAPWKPFREGTTTTKVVNGRTVTVGRIAESTPVVGTCGSEPSIWIRTWLQFRTTDATGRLHVSNVKGDSTCVPTG